MRRLIIIVLLVLVIPKILIAEGSQGYPVTTSRSQKIMDQAPRTPEELLLVIKSFMDNPQMNGYEFAEKVSGSSREYWTTGPQRQGFGKDNDILFQEYYTGYCNTHIKQQSEVVKKMIQPLYYISEIDMVVNSEQLLAITIGFIINTDSLTPMTLVVTPAELREVLGKPTRTYVSSPWLGGFSSGHYYLTYYYQTKKYELKIILFELEGERQELRRERISHSAEEMWAERKRRSKLTNQGAYRAIKLEITPLY